MTFNLYLVSFKELGVGVDNMNCSTMLVAKLSTEL